MASRQEIIEKAKKVYALVNQGIAGEALSAKIQLDKILAKYNVSLDELTDERTEERFYRYWTDLDKHLFCQIVGKFNEDYGTDIKVYLVTKGKRNKRRTIKEYCIDCAVWQHVEIRHKYDFFRHELWKEHKKQTKLIEYAFYSKHQLLIMPSDDDVKDSNDSMSFDDYWAIAALEQAMSNVSFHKAIENN